MWSGDSGLSGMHTVTLRQLEVFKHIVDTGTFSGAAAALKISQPSISMHVRSLEAHLRQPIFERRRGQTPMLTDVGRRLYDHADGILRQSDRAISDIQSLVTTKENVLSFAAHRFIGNHLLSKPLVAFAQENPGIEIIANIGSLDQVVDKIRNRDVDLGLFLAHGRVDGVRTEVIGRQELVFIANRDHPLASQQKVTYDDLADFPYIGPVSGTAYDRMLRSVFEEVGFNNHKTVTQSQNTVLRKELLLSGVGFSCALRNGWRDLLDSGQLVRLDVTGAPLLLDLRLGILPDRRISNASKKFIRYVRLLKRRGAFDS